MARDQAPIDCLAGEWTQLTNGDVTEITFEVLGYPVYIRFTTDETTPTEATGLKYSTGQGELKKAMSDLTNLASADRVWAMPIGPYPSVVQVDHA